MTDVTDDYLKRIADGVGLTPDAAAELLPVWARTLLRHRAMLRRVESVLAQLDARKRDPASQMWAADLHAAVTGRKFLYRCPDHGDRQPLSRRHESGVCCGEVFRDRLGTCTKTAVLVGEVDAL